MRAQAKATSSSLKYFADKKVCFRCCDALSNYVGGSRVPVISWRAHNETAAVFGRLSNGVHPTDLWYLRVGRAEARISDRR